MTSGAWSRSSRGIAAVTTGSLAAQAILVAATPVLSRVYPPESVGHFSVVLGVAAIVGPAAALKFDAALLLAPTEEGAGRLLRLGLLSSVLIASLAVLAAWGAGAAGFRVPWTDLAWAPLWVGAGVLATATYSVLTQAALRARAYSAVARRGPVQSLATVASQLGFGLVSQSGAALLSGQLVGRAFGYAALLRAAQDLLRRPTSGSYRSLLRSYWKFPLVFAPSGVLNSLGTQLPLVLVATAFGAGEAGQLGMAQRLAFIPGTLLGASVGQVVAAELSSEVREGRGRGRELYLRTSGRLALVGSAVTLVLVLVAPWLLPLCLGGQWSQSGPFVRAMAICVGIGLVASPLSQVYLIHQSLASVAVDVSRVVLIAVAAGVAHALQTNAVQTIWLISTAQSVNYVVTWVYGLRIVSEPHPVPQQSLS